MEKGVEVADSRKDPIIAFRKQVLAKAMETEEVILRPDIAILQELKSFYTDVYVPLCNKGNSLEKGEIDKKVSLLVDETLRNGFSAIVVIKHLLLMDAGCRYAYHSEEQDEEQIRIDAVQRTKTWLVGLSNSGVERRGIHVANEYMIFKTGAFPQVRMDLTRMVIESYKLVLGNYMEFLQGRRKILLESDPELLDGADLDSVRFPNLKQVYLLYRSRLKAGAHELDPVEFALKPIEDKTRLFDTYHPLRIDHIPFWVFIQQQRYARDYSLTEDQAEIPSFTRISLRLYRAQSVGHHLDLYYIRGLWMNRRTEWVIFSLPSKVILHQMEQFLLGYSFMRSLQVGYPKSDK